MPSLLPSRFLFRFASPCRYHDPLWTKQGANLGEEYRLLRLPELDDQPVWADVRAAWSEAGLAFSVCVQGKNQSPWCRESRPEESDALQLWIDTRDVHNVHRATRYCHRFIFLPCGAGRKLDDPVAERLPIHRAKDLPNPFEDGLLQVVCVHKGNDYQLDAFAPAETLTGFDPIEHPHLGFTYAVIDRELGTQTFGVGGPMAYQEDPSLWMTLDLTRD